MTNVLPSVLGVELEPAGGVMARVRPLRPLRGEMLY